ncbi:OmpH family outer membrane protein [bacterium]|nr:OmpH family outer membrane protein [bacterium]
MKKIITLFVLLFMSCGFAMAKDNYGFIDINTIMAKYTVAANYTNSVKQRQTEIQKLLTDANKKLTATKDETAKKTIEANAKKQIQPKLDALATYQKQQSTKIQNNINAAISKVAKANNYALVLNGNSVAFGAVNITDLVVKELNLNFK